MTKTYCDVCNKEIKDNVADYRFTIDFPSTVDCPHFKSRRIHLCETCTTGRLLNIIRENPGMTLSECFEEVYNQYHNIPDWMRKYIQLLIYYVQKRG
jgi:hypothetical protein